MTNDEIQEKRKSLARKMVDAKTPEELDEMLEEMRQLKELSEKLGLTFIKGSEYYENRKKL